MSTVRRFTTTSPFPAGTPTTTRTSRRRCGGRTFQTGTTELVLLCEDPDAPAEPFVHWLVTGIDPAADGVDEGETPAGGREWANGFGERGWGGPQPPVGDQPHHYVFHLYAVADPVRLPTKPSADDVHRQVERASLLASAITVGTYSR